MPNKRERIPVDPNAIAKLKDAKRERKKSESEVVVEEKALLPVLGSNSKIQVKEEKEKVSKTKKIEIGARKNEIRISAKNNVGDVLSKIRITLSFTNSVIVSGMGKTMQMAINCCNIAKREIEGVEVSDIEIDETRFDDSDRVRYSSRIQIILKRA